MTRSFAEPPMSRAMKLMHHSTNEVNLSPSRSKNPGCMLSFACWVAIARPPGNRRPRVAAGSVKFAKTARKGVPSKDFTVRTREKGVNTDRPHARHNRQVRHGGGAPETGRGGADSSPGNPPWSAGGTPALHGGPKDFREPGEPSGVSSVSNMRPPIWSVFP